MDGGCVIAEQLVKNGYLADVKLEDAKPRGVLVVTIVAEGVLSLTLLARGKRSGKSRALFVRYQIARKDLSNVDSRATKNMQASSATGIMRFGVVKSFRLVAKYAANISAHRGLNGAASKHREKIAVSSDEPL